MERLHESSGRPTGERREVRFSIVVFPGSNCDHDAIHAVGTVLGEEGIPVWHGEARLPVGTDVVIVPGGFSYGEYLRPGAIARFAPIMGDVVRHAEAGGIVVGICNGFQILCEVGLLPGVLLRNADLRFHCHDVHVRVETKRTPITSGLGLREVLRLPIAHGDGSYFVPDDVLRELEASGQIVFRYCTAGGEVTPDANPNGSTFGIAGVSSPEGNVIGLMPHPERAAEAAVGGEDGLRLLRSLVDAVVGERIAERAAR
jgi:phosphoribosylformylglycinamidine synthase subunit PurQ / glutaminase